jgi:hypothetical protein
MTGWETAENSRRKQIAAMRAAGKNGAQIAAELGISKQAVCQHLAKAKRERHWSAAFSGRFKSVVADAALNRDLFELPEHEAAQLAGRHSQPYYLRQPYFGAKCLRILQQWLTRHGLELGLELTSQEAERLGLDRRP